MFSESLACVDTEVSYFQILLSCTKYFFDTTRLSFLGSYMRSLCMLNMSYEPGMLAKVRNVLMGENWKNPDDDDDDDSHVGAESWPPGNLVWITEFYMKRGFIEHVKSEKERVFGEAYDFGLGHLKLHDQPGWRKKVHSLIIASPNIVRPMGCLVMEVCNKLNAFTC